MRYALLGLEGSAKGGEKKNGAGNIVACRTNFTRVLCFEFEGSSRGRVFTLDDDQKGGEEEWKKIHRRTR